MNKVVIDMTISLDGYVAGPDDGKQYPLGKNGGMAIFDWYFSGKNEYRNPVFRPEEGVNLDVVKQAFEESGAFITGRKTYDITNGWNGRHPVDGLPIFILTHNPPPAHQVPKGPSSLTFVTNGIEHAIELAKAAAGDKEVKLGGGVPLFDIMDHGVRLEKLYATDGPLATHIRYRVLKS